MRRHQKGFSLIEVLIAMAVVALGLLAVATFQANLMKESGSSKAKSEALAIAQAHLDQLRNYTDGVALLHYTTPVTTETEFNTAFANTAGSTPVSFVDASNVAITISGTNAVFSPKYRISTGSVPGKAVAVTVEWAEKDGTTQSVTLNTQLGWESPGAVGDLASNDPTALIPSPTGRAHLGEGTLETSVVTANTVTDFGDNTLSVNDGTGDLKLVVYDSSLTDQQVVLTLENACVTGSCTNFVRISGRVYIDKTAQSVTPGDLYVKASDAAFCHRYYTDADGVVQNVTSTTTTTNTPDSRGGNYYDNVGDYEYYDYTCYLGGGWHGNIGLVKAGGLGVHDLACLGDPTDADDYDQPVITARRAYRAMIHTVSGGVIVTNPNTGLPVYYSAGVADAVTIDDQDYLFTSLSGNPTDSDCFSASAPMTRTDATVDGVSGALFEGMPDAFFCLNQDSSYVDPTLFNFNDTAHTGYALASTCPYDPTDPPTAVNTVSGTVTINSDTSGNEALIGANLTLNTSDAAGNCTSPVTFTYNSGAHTYTGAYTCEVFHKGTGWSGYINLTYTKADVSDPSVTCTTSQINLVNVQTNITGQNFNTCSTGANRIISGNIVVTSSTSGLESDLATIVSIDASDSGENCTKGAFTYSAGSYTSAYSCTVLDQGTGWSGNVAITSTQVNNRNVSCTTSQLNFTNLTADSSGQNFSTCSVVTTSTITITGNANSTSNNKVLTSATITPDGGSAIACAIATTSGDDRSYTCSTTFTTSTWSGTLTLNSSSGSVICHEGSGSTNSKTEPYANAAGSYTYNITVKGSSGDCPVTD
jgi:type IV pilus modification protein PilV